MPPFIYYHIDPFSILVVIEHITFASVFSTTHVSLSIDFTSALAEVSSPTDQLLDGPLGAPLRRANTRSRDRPQQRITPLRWPIHNGGGIIYRVALRDKYSGIVTHINEWHIWYHERASVAREWVISYMPRVDNNHITLPPMWWSIYDILE